MVFGRTAISAKAIYFNAPALSPGGSGIQTYCRNVIAGVASRADFPVLAGVNELGISELPAEVTPVLGCGSIDPHQVGLVHRLGHEKPVHRSPQISPQVRSVPEVVTAFDTRAFTEPGENWARQWTAEQNQLRTDLQAADAVITVSEFTAQLLSEHLGITATVTHIAPRPGLRSPTSAELAEVSSKYRLPNTFVLYVGNIASHKGLGGLIHACVQIGVPLVLAGAPTFDFPTTGGVIRLGYVPEEDLAPLYGAAAVVAYPSYYEGSGLPPIEAIACGAVVAATSVGALPEVLGAAGYPLVEPGDVVGLAELLSAATCDDAYRSFMLQTGAEAVAELSWDRHAGQVLDVYAQLGLG